MEVISSEQRVKNVSRATVTLPENNWLIQQLFSWETTKILHL